MSYKILIPLLRIIRDHHWVANVFFRYPFRNRLIKYLMKISFWDSLMVFVWRAKLLYCDFDKLLMRKACGACGSCILWMGSMIGLFGALSEKNVQISYTFDSSRINMLKAISTAR